MDILKWNKDTNAWEIPILGTDKITGEFIDPTFGGDVTVTDEDHGIVLTSTNYVWRITIDDTGTIKVNEVTPP